VLFAWASWAVVCGLVEKPMKCKAERDTVLEAAWIFLAVTVFGLVIAIRIRLLGIPLERDNGEYAYAAGKGASASDHSMPGL